LEHPYQINPFHHKVGGDEAVANEPKIQRLIPTIACRIRCDQCLDERVKFVGRKGATNEIALPHPEVTEFHQRFETRSSKNR